jgi:hypothetical protein
MNKESVAVKTLLAVFVTAVALAAVSSGLSWILGQHPGTEGRDTPQPTPAFRRAPPCGDPGSEMLAQGREHSGTASSRAGAPAAAHSVDADPASTLAEEIHERWRAVGERESQLLARQEALTLIHADILAEQATIEEIRQRMEDELSRVALQPQGLAPAPPPLGPLPQQGSGSDVAQARGGNAEIAPAAYDSTTADTVVALLQRLADNGNLDTVVKLLGAMNERLAAKILTALSDPHPDLAARLIEILQHRKQQEATATTASGGTLRG